MGFYLGFLVAILLQGLAIISILVTSNKGNKTSNYLLSSLIVLFLYYAFIKILNNTNLIVDYPFLIQTYRPVFILACINIYFYCCSVTGHKTKFKKLDAIYLIPFFVYLIYKLPFFFSSNKSKVLSLSEQAFSVSWFIDRGFLLLVFLYFFAISFNVLYQYKQRIKNTYSNIDNIKLNWLRNLLIIFSIIWLSALTRFLTTSGNVGYENKFFVPVMLCLTIIFIGFYAIKQSSIFINEIEVETIDGKNPVAKSIINSKAVIQNESYNEKLINSKERLINHLNEKKSHRNPDLKLKDLAEEIELTPHELSKLINSHLNGNFYDLINSLRIDEAKEILTNKQTQNNKIISIAYEVGFNSKSTFNSAFKKYTGLTPTQFKQVLIN